MAEICRTKNLHASAAGLWRSAFAAMPSLTDKLSNQLAAATEAALAGPGRGDEAAALTDRTRTEWRGQTITWLRSYLEASDKALEGKSLHELYEILRQLKRVKRDPNLSGIREAESLAKLGAAERGACRSLWADMDALLERTVCRIDAARERL